MAETNQEPLEVITPTEVLERVADQVDSEIGVPGRIEITRQSDVLYVVRVYPVGSDDYEGMVVEL